jgi:hypothetical protein
VPPPASAPQTVRRPVFAWWPASDSLTGPHYYSVSTSIYLFCVCVCVIERGQKTTRDVIIPIKATPTTHNHNNNIYIKALTHIDIHSHSPPHTQPNQQALALATALDREKGLATTTSSSSTSTSTSSPDASGNGIAALLAAPAVQAELQRRSLACKLDVILAYLRRVHLVVYYTGEECKDEGDLLFVAPQVYKRAEPYKPPAAAAAGGGGGGGGGSAVGEEEGKEGEGQGQEEEECEWGKRVDERVGKLLAALAAGEGPGVSGRFADLAAKAAAQGEAEEKARQKWLLDSMSNEDEGRWRCAAHGCSKLFKSADFLQKHLLLKHAEGLDAALATVGAFFVVSVWVNVWAGGRDGWMDGWMVGEIGMMTPTHRPTHNTPPPPIPQPKTKQPKQKKTNHHHQQVRDDLVRQHFEADPEKPLPPVQVDKGSGNLRAVPVGEVLAEVAQVNTRCCWGLLLGGLCCAGGVVGGLFPVGGGAHPHPHPHPPTKPTPGPTHSLTHPATPIQNQTTTQSHRCWART